MRWRLAMSYIPTIHDEMFQQHSIQHLGMSGWLDVGRLIIIYLYVQKKK